MIQAAQLEATGWYQAQSELLRTGLVLKMALTALTELGTDTADRFSKDLCVSKLLMATKARSTFLDTIKKAECFEVALPTEELPGMDAKDGGTFDIQVCDMSKVFSPSCKMRTTPTWCGTWLPIVQLRWPSLSSRLVNLLRVLTWRKAAGRRVYQTTLALKMSWTKQQLPSWNWKAFSSRHIGRGLPRTADWGGL